MIDLIVSKKLTAYKKSQALICIRNYNTENTLVMQPCVVNECKKFNLLLTLLSVGYFGSFKEKYDGIVGPSRWNDALNCKHRIRQAAYTLFTKQYLKKSGRLKYYASTTFVFIYSKSLKTKYYLQVCKFTLFNSNKLLVCFKSLVSTTYL